MVARGGAAGLEHAEQGLTSPEDPEHRRHLCPQRGFSVCEDNPSSPCCRVTVPSPEQTPVTLQAVVVLYSLASLPPAWIGKSPDTEIPQLKGITPP